MPQEFSLIPNGNKSRFAARFSAATVLAQYRSLIILAAVLALLWFLSLAFSWWENSSREATVAVRAEQERILSELEESELEGAKDFAAQVRGVQRLLRSHVTPSEVTEPFEASVHDEVLITSFDLDIPSRTLRIAASAPSLTVMGEQFVQWRDEAVFIEDIEMEQFSSTSDSRIIFSVIVTVKEGFLYGQEDADV